MEGGNGIATPAPDRNPDRTPLSTAESAAPAAARTTERSAVVLALFGPSVGPCVGDFSTTYNRVNGRLYAATRAILFYSNLFGFERRLCLQFSDIESIEAYRSTSIRISTVDCEDHVFRKFPNRDEVLQVIKELYEKELSFQDGMGGTSRVQSRIVRDDYNFARWVSHAEDGAEYNSLEDSSARDRLASEISQPDAGDNDDHELKAVRPRSQSVPSMNKLLVDRSKLHLDVNLRPKIFRRSQSTHYASTPAVPSVVVPETLETVPSDSVADDATRTLDMPPEGSDPPAPGFDMADAWSAAKQPYSEVALQNVVLPCSLEHFMYMFLSNEAIFPIAKYQKEVVHDKGIVYTEWKKRQGPDSFPPIFDRVIDFVHPLNNTVGPSQAKTNRKQSFQRFGTFGATLLNTTIVQGVPGADCFCVEDRWIIENVTKNTVKLSIFFQINFTKRTMFKPIIQKNVKAETKKWFQGYSEFVRQALQEDEKKGETSPASPLTSSKDEIGVSSDDEVDVSSWPANTTALALFLLFCLLGLQTVYLQLSVNAMQDQLVEVQNQNTELAAMMKHIISRSC